MRTLGRLLFLAAALALGCVTLIKVLYRCSWKEALQIADRFMEDLLGGRREA